MLKNLRGSRSRRCSRWCDRHWPLGAGGCCFRSGFREAEPEAGIPVKAIYGGGALEAKGVGEAR